MSKAINTFLNCKICDKPFICHHLSHHIKRSHKMTAIDYYLKYLGKIGKCKECGKETKFNSINRGFKKHCSSLCSNSNTAKKKLTESVCLKKYGVKNIFQTNTTKLKIKNKMMEKYGVFNPSSSPIIKRKKTLSVIKHYGSDKKYRDFLLKARIKACLKKYGVEYYQQSWDGAYKSIKSSYKKKSYKLPSGKIIYKQGYEPNFLDYVFNNKLLKEKEITYYPKGIQYKAIDNKIRYYFPDFYIRKLNLIIECKSTWTIKTDKNIKRKKMAVQKLGHQYIRIINNNFRDFCSFLKNKCQNKVVF